MKFHGFEYLGRNLEMVTLLFQIVTIAAYINTLRPRQNGRHFADDTFKHIFLKETVRISITISLNFVPKSPIDQHCFR